MSLRCLGSLLTRRLSSSGSCTSRSRAQAKALAPAAGLSPRSLHSRDFSIDDGAGVYGGVATAALVGLLGIFYFRKGVDVSDKETKKVTTVVVSGEEETQLTQEANKQLVGEKVSKYGRETKKHNDDDFSLEDYLAEMTKIAVAQKKARYERSCNKADKKMIKSEAIKDEVAMKDEAAMKARFEKWIKEYGKTYKNKEEKALRYELFKAFANMVDKATAEGGAVFVTNHTADWTEEECQCLYDSDNDWDDYLDHIRSLIDKRNAKGKKASRD